MKNHITKPFHRVVIVFLCACILLACSKEEAKIKTITASGYTINGGTGDTLKNVKLRLRADVDGGSTVLRDFEQVLDSTFSDSSGYYQFTFRCTPNIPLQHEDYRYYAVEPVGQHLWRNPNMFLTNFGCNNIDNRNSVDVVVIPLTWVKVHIKNEQPTHKEDSIFFYGPFDDGSYYNRPSWRFPMKGKNIDSTFYIALRSTTTPLVYWDITKNNITSRSAMDFACSSLDTCTLNVFF